MTDKRKPGRPRSDEPKGTVSTWISAQDHDRLIKLANQKDQSVSQIVGQILRQRLSE